jgi:phenylacetate-CoA ligase
MDFRPELSWEFMSADEIAARTLRALRNHIVNVKECSAFYRSVLSQAVPDDIRSIDDFTKLPFTERDNMAEQSSRFLGVDPSHIVETVMTLGTTGKPLPFVLTAGDLDRIAFSNALSMHSMGMTPADRVLLLSSLDRFSMDGMSHYRGAIMTGANVMRIGVGTTMHDLLQKYLQFFRPTILIGVPSELLDIAIDSRKNGFDVAACKVQKAIGIAESLHFKTMHLNASGELLEKMWDAKVFSMYSATELSVSYCDCEYRSGAHSHPELVYTEIVNDKGKPVPDGEIGELVATPLGVEGVPLVRYKTGDMTFKVTGSCSCGRHSSRLGPILGRKADCIKYNGVIVFPHNLSNALKAMEEIKDYQIVLENDTKGADAITIHVAALPALLEKIVQTIRSASGMYIPVLISNIPTIQAMRKESGVPTPIIDKRGDRVVKSA